MASSGDGWNAYSRKYRYIPEDDIIISDITINTNETYVSTNSIRILQNTSLQSGTYKISYDCEEVYSGDNQDLNESNVIVQIDEDASKNFSEVRYVIGDCGCKDSNTDVDNDLFNREFSNIKIVPNPFNNTFEIILSDNIQIYKVDIVNVTGKIVKTESFSKSEKYIINGNELNKGIYFIKIYTGKGVILKKIIKN